ncbi:MAG: DUF4962 domain-containing protein, partial [Gammaproteobacteria bacterium]|nr:DUF4962 domain-containing protein [Gammaproteobacteria bacterium]
MAYGTLFPLSNWQTPDTDPFHLMLQRGLHNASRADMLTNILVYMPLGVLLMWSMLSIRCSACRLFLAVLCCALLSLVLEYSQAHLPGRVPSMGDLILNISGGGIGAIITLLVGTDTVIGKRLFQIRSTYFHPGPTTNLGLVVVGFWALSQLSPLVPSIDLGNLRQGLKPLINTLQSPATLEWIRVAEYSFGIAALGVLSGSLQRISYNSQLRFILIVLTVLLLKIPIIERQISLEACLGMGFGVILSLTIATSSLKTRFGSAAIMLLGSVLAAALYQPPNPSSITSIPPFSMNLVPFRNHLTNNIAGIIDILGGLWPFLFFSYIAIVFDGRRRIWIAVTGAALIFCIMFAAEWKQQYILGRTSDITDAVLPVLAWLLPWFYPELWKPETANTSASANISPKRPSRFIILPALGIIVAVAVTASYWLSGSRTLPISSEQAKKQPLPPPEDITSLKLPGFRYLHPRLPAPTTDQVIQIKRHNPKFFNNHRKAAKNGRGKFYSAILMAYVEPGSIDLELLYNRLMDMNMSWRGHSQAKPLAMAYDWLYVQWSQEQRDQLRSKVLEASDYLIHRIRVKQLLSPYNVYLYNSPLQALMATTLASYGESPKAEPHMRWTADYWKNRVLPVWRQVMGKNGGWHEGGEYVGIGIGQAIYQLTAMWRKATGEDLFQTEPGLRGFLDFLIYRTRPDNTHMRWGDG